MTPTTPASPQPRCLRRDLSTASVVAGFTAVLIGYSSSAAIVLQAAYAVGATPAQAQSWLMTLGLATGVLCIAISLYYRAPVLFAWSTPGAALIGLLPPGTGMNEAVAGFMFAAALMTLCGVTGLFDRVARAIPRELAAAMLAGVLVRFGLTLFASAQAHLAIVLGMLVGYLVTKRVAPRYGVLAALAIGIAIWLFSGQAEMAQLSFALPALEWVTPHFSLPAIVSIGLPLFIVTIASQNLPGIAVLRQNHYQTPVSPLITASGLVTLVLAPFGVFAVNLAAITAAICAGPEAHEDPARRYTASIAAGVFYLLAGLAGAAIVTLFAVLPPVIVAAIAGIALLGTLGASLSDALLTPTHREAALITFLVTASNLNLMSISSPVWGLLAGGLVIAVAHRRKG